MQRTVFSGAALQQRAASWCGWHSAMDVWGTKSAELLQQRRMLHATENAGEGQCQSMLPIGF
jgi:hypothetical protein